MTPQQTTDNVQPTLRAPVFPEASSPSWWQQQVHGESRFDSVTSDIEAEVAVIGGGISGTSTTLHLAREGVDVVQLEARTIASGASGRNGGFLLAGLAHRFPKLSALLGKTRACELYLMTVNGRDELLRTAAAIGAGTAARRTGSLRVAMAESELAELDTEAALLREHNFPVELLGRRDLPPILQKHGLGGLRFADDGALRPAEWVTALAVEAKLSGATIYEHSPVISILDGDDDVQLELQSGHKCRAKKVVVAVEAWLSGLLPELSGWVLPYRSQVLAQRATTEMLPCPTWSRYGWDYVQQTSTGEIIIGGEQIEDVQRLRHFNEQTEPEDQAWLESWLQTYLGLEPDVITRWGGLLSQTPDGFPFVGPLPHRPRVLTCGGWGGAGNVLGFVGGQLITKYLQNGDAIPTEFLPERVKG